MKTVTVVFPVVAGVVQNVLTIENVWLTSTREGTYIVQTSGGNKLYRIPLGSMKYAEEVEDV